MHDEMSYTDSWPALLFLACVIPSKTSGETRLPTAHGSTSVFHLLCDDGQRIVYLDNAATTLKPQSVSQAITDYYTFNGANIHRGKHRLSEDASDAYEASRVAIATYIGAAANEVVFPRNTTDALNLVASGLMLDRDAYIVGSFDAHHSQILPQRFRHAFNRFFGNARFKGLRRSRFLAILRTMFRFSGGSRVLMRENDIRASHKRRFKVTKTFHYHIHGHVTVKVASFLRGGAFFRIST
jgi:hypothetical protein